MATITICDRCGEKANGEFTHPYRIVDDERAIGLNGNAVDICKNCAMGFNRWWQQAKPQPDIGAWQELPKVGGTDA